jgi:hypothetical protein
MGIVGVARWYAVVLVPDFLLRTSRGPVAVVDTEGFAPGSDIVVGAARRRA